MERYNKVIQKLHVNEEFELPVGSCSVSDIQDYLRQKATDNSPIRIYVNKIENRATFEIKRVLSRIFNT